MKAHTLILMTLTLGLGVAFARAPARLSLRDALALAEKQNLDLIAARERRAVALVGVRIAGQRPNPTVNFTALRDEPHEGLFLDQPIEIGGKRRHRIDVAEQESRLTDVEIETLARQIRRKVREAFQQAVFARAETELAGRVSKLAEHLQQIARERFEAGAVAQLEVIQADLEVSRARAEFELAQQREKVSLSQLNALLNEPAETAWELEGSLEALPPQLLLTELVGRAYASNPELQHLAQEQQIERRRHALLKAERIPDVAVQFGLDFNSPRDFAIGPRTQLALALPLFSRNQGQLAQSRANERLLEAETEATKRAVAGRVEAAYLELSARQSQVGLYRQGLLPAARRLENLAEESYRAGKSNILTVLDAQHNVQQIEREYLDSLLALQSDFAALEETAGAALD